MFMSVFFAMSVSKDEGFIPISVQSIIKINTDTNEDIHLIESNKPNINIISRKSYEQLVETKNFTHTIITYDNDNKPSKVRDKSIGQIYDIVDSSDNDIDHIISVRNEIIYSNKMIYNLKLIRTVQIMLGATFLFIYCAFLKISLDNLFFK